MTAITKFDELRLKTNRQLIRLLNRELDLGICYAQRALKAADRRASVERYYAPARSAHAEAARLILLAEDIDHDERRQIESRLQRLWEMIEPLTAMGASPTPTEDEIAALARALWKAKGCPEGLPEEDWFQAERVLTGQPFAAINA